jgi:hypothetical protein
LWNVKAINHIEQNRPVHLALRDSHYEHATELLKFPKNHAEQKIDAAAYGNILCLLRTARRHAEFAVRDNSKNEADERFCSFINMLIGNVKTVLSMLDLKHSVEVEDGFFFSFLHANYASVSLLAEEYERRASDILRCMRTTLDLASEAFAELKQANQNAFSTAESERYRKARAHSEGALEKNPDQLENETHVWLFP